AFATLLLASRPARKALSLPAVKVHLAPMVSAPGPAIAPAGGGQKAEPLKPTAKPAAPAKPAKATPPAKVAAATKATVGKKAERRPAAVEGAAASSGTAASPPSAGAAGGLGLAGSGVEGPPFPYQYYLERVLAAIEQSWFKPPALPGTRCRVRCRIGRSGELKEAGLEEPSGVGAFDRAALRAVYAAAPFPPLPQGFGGSELILHLEFVE
ncbi:MAG: TonB family protein, partial [Thermoanaerobaculum sp.]